MLEFEHSSLGMTPRWSKSRQIDRQADSSAGLVGITPQKVDTEWEKSRWLRWIKLSSDKYAPAGCISRRTHG